MSFALLIILIIIGSFVFIYLHIFFKSADTLEIFFFFYTTDFLNIPVFVECMQEDMYRNTGVKVKRSNYNLKGMSTSRQCVDQLMEV